MTTEFGVPVTASRSGSRRLLFASLVDPLDPRSMSGLPYSMIQGLRKNGREVVAVGPFRHPLRFPVKAASWVRNRVLSARYSSERESFVVRAYARQLQMAVARERPNAILACDSLLVSRVSTSVPTAMWVDATVGCAAGYYPFMTGVSRRTLTNAVKAEAGAMARCARVITASEWVARAVVSEYHVPSDRVYWVPFGANIVPIAWTGVRHDIGTRLLWIGGEWFRKGGDVAVETVRLMRQAGADVTLDIVGRGPPAGASVPSFVTQHGFVNFGTPEGRAQLDSLYRSAALFLSPTRAEMMGAAFRDAAAFGIPSLGPATGGVSSALRDDVTGVLCSEHAGPEEYAREATLLLSDPVRYHRLSKGARRVYENELNWLTACRRVLDIVDGIDTG